MMIICGTYESYALMYNIKCTWLFVQWWTYNDVMLWGMRMHIILAGM